MAEQRRVVALEIYRDIDDIQASPGSWMMDPSLFALGLPGVYRGYRAAGANFLAPHRTGAIYVAQSAAYASSYHRPPDPDDDCRLWRVRFELRRPVVSARPVLSVGDAQRAALPPGTDAIVMTRGDGNAGNGPVIALLDPSCILEAVETWPRHEVQRAIQDLGPDAVPEDVLADYPALRRRVAEMRARWADRPVPWRRF